MKKYRLAYYTWRRKRLREAMRKINGVATPPPGKSGIRYHKFRKRYDSLSMKWWNARESFLGDRAFGMDITNLPISQNDIRFYPEPTRSPEEEARYQAGIAVKEDKSSKVEFKRHDDGTIWMYRDGKVAGEQPEDASALGLNDRKQNQ